MKKSYTWQLLWIIFAVYLILLAFIPELNLIFDYFRFTLLIALGLLWLGAENRNAILFFLGLGFSALYIREITPEWYLPFNGGPLFFGLLVLGIAIHSLNKNKKQNHLMQFQTDGAKPMTNDSSYLTVVSHFKENYEFSNTNDLQAVTIKSFCGSSKIDLSQAKFTNNVTYITIENTCSSCQIRLPKHVGVLNALKSNLSDVAIPTQTQSTSKQVYLTGSNLLSQLSMIYVD
ncbi:MULTISPECIES: LiaF domain-containing protein [unclassified Streptococcus]|uniref:LiaF domain-containing protein n=1 Tax=unclassified Streptococcus TaxID=2608887 RepID=UPI00066FD9EB|nr:MULTISPECIES: LiaF domain-containing protein [unclassified Streptococcus]